VPPTLKAAGVAYSNSKLVILCYAHELQRRVPEGINVAVFEPGFMPGTGLSRQHSPRVQRMGQGMQRLPLPGIASPVKSGPALASVTLGQRWAHLRDGDFVVIDKERDVMPIANDPDRERQLWDATRKCPATTKIARPVALTCGEESSLTIHGGQGARFARFKKWPGVACADEDCSG
jgi:hypothetical protein